MRIFFPFGKPSNFWYMPSFTKTTMIWIISAGFAISSAAQKVGNSLAGVWKYENQGKEGICIASPTHIIWIESERGRIELPDVNPGDEAKALALSTVEAAAGEWKMESPNRARARFIYSVDPGQVGKYSSWDFVIDGDKITYWIIDQNGNRTSPGFARKISEWSSAGDCSVHNGVWDYVDLKGIYLHSGNYGAWFIQNKPVDAATGLASKASAFDAINAAVVVGSKYAGKKYVWSVLHAVDARREGESYITELDASGLPIMTLWFVDHQGKPMGSVYKTRRIAD
jgi:hypothetical protein